MNPRVGLVFGIGLIGLGQMGMGPFAKSATPTNSTSSPEFVTREATGVSVNQSYDIALDNGEIIVGQSYGFNSGSINQSGGCSAFLIKGPGRFSFSVTDGAWLRYKNVTDTNQAESLLQEQANYLINNYACNATFVKYSRLP